MSALPQLCHTAYETALFRAAMLCAFFGFMRISEFASVSKTRIQRSLLLASDVHFLKGDGGSASVLLSFRHTKAKQTGPPERIRLVQSFEEDVCPVLALACFQQIDRHRQAPFSVT